MKPIRRIAIVNRGEPAIRLIRAARELGHQLPEPIKTIALYTDSDAAAMFTREADERYGLGSTTFVDGKTGQRKNRYLDYGTLERALVETKADAAWVGWGFVAEHAAFADLCKRLGVVFIGPDAEVMHKLGDKIASKRIAERAEVPVAPWSGGAVESVDDAVRIADELGYPLMIKATAGGGGRGIREVNNADEVRETFGRARDEAYSSFGNPDLFLERRVNGARHIEVQIIGDRHGTVWAVGVRDCTLQRRHQKVLEEAPSPALTVEQERYLCDASVRLAKAAGYHNAGTVEFLYEPETKTFSFMEVNARLQVEHPVTEVTTGHDMVKLQIHVAAGGKLEGEPQPSRGHAIELRINAEDAENGFAPAPGRVELLRLPSGPGLRVDAGVSEGDEIAPEFDSMIAKLIAHGRDRREAIDRLARGLQETRIAIRGGTSNKSFLLGLLSREDVREARYDNSGSTA